MIASRHRAVALALAGGLAAAGVGAGCGGSRRAAEEDVPAAERGDSSTGGRGATKREAPDEPAEKGVPPEGGRPRVPASPEALLAPGAISDLQRALADRGYLGAHHDGELDEPTSLALRKFQAEEQLAETGFPDRETLTRLGIEPRGAYGRDAEE